MGTHNQAVIEAVAKALSLYRTPNIPKIPDDVMEKMAVLSILVKNKDKNFVARALDPKNSPVYDRPGFHGSHYMGWTTIEDGPLAGKHIVYPNIVQKTPEAGLTMLEGRDAVDHALRTGEFIPFDNPEEADWFSRRYKSIWPDQ